MGSWRALQARLGRGGIKQDKLVDHLCEYLWRYTINELVKRATNLCDHRGAEPTASTHTLFARNDGPHGFVARFTSSFS